MIAAVVLLVVGFLVGFSASKLHRLLFFRSFSVARARQFRYRPYRRPLRYSARKFKRGLYLRSLSGSRFWRAFDRLDLARRADDEAMFTH